MEIFQRIRPHCRTYIFPNNVHRNMSRMGKKKRNPFRMKAIRKIRTAGGGEKKTAIGGKKKTAGGGEKKKTVGGGEKKIAGGGEEKKAAGGGEEKKTARGGEENNDAGGEEKKTAELEKGRSKLLIFDF